MLSVPAAAGFAKVFFDVCLYVNPSDSVLPGSSGRWYVKYHAESKNKVFFRKKRFFFQIFFGFRGKNSPEPVTDRNDGG